MDIHRLVWGLQALWRGTLILVAYPLGMIPVSFWFTYLQDAIESGYISDCSVNPFHVGSVEFVKIVAGLLLLPAATSSAFNFWIFTYVLAATVATQQIPCLAYAVPPTFRLATFYDVTNLRAALWPGLSIFAPAQAHFNDDIRAIVDNIPLRFIIWCGILMMPRLIVGTRGDGAYGTTMMGYRRRAVAMAVFYHAMNATLPTWCQWLCHMLQPAASALHNIAGAEWCAISGLVLLYGYPPVLACTIALLAEIYLHPLRRQLVDRAVQSQLLRIMRASFLVFLRTYLLLALFRTFCPQAFRRIISWSTAIIFTLFPVVWFIGFDRYPRSFPRESESTVSGFKHAPLRNSRTKIRLLRVYPSVWGGNAVKCDLVQVPLDGSGPLYCTISYRWPQDPKTPNVTVQPRTKTATITINGQELKVYREVESILKDVRQPFTVRMVWIDQICINQDNNLEKSDQVALMSKIYSNCNRVFACLPRDDIDAHGYLSTLRRIAKVYRTEAEKDVDEASTLILRLRDSRRLYDFTRLGGHAPLLPLSNEKQLQALYRLLSHEWFERVWINQEIALAPRITFLYGSQEIDWRNLVLGMTTLARTDLANFHEVLNKPGVDGIYNLLVRENLRLRISEENRLGLLPCLVLCMRFKCGYPIDTVYGLLGLVGEADRERHRLFPSYAVSSPQLFKRLAQSLIVGSNLSEQMTVLRFAGMREAVDPSEKFVEEFHQPPNPLPSWAPNWAIPLEAAILEHRNPRFDYQASKTLPRGRRPIRFDPDDSDVLICHGLHIDVVVTLVDTCGIEPVWSTRFPFRDSLEATCQRWPTAYGPTKQPILEAFWRTISTDTHPAIRPAPLDHVYEHTRRLLEGFEADRAGQQPPPTKDLSKKYEYLKTLAGSNTRFTHLLATHLSKTTPETGRDITDLLHRGFDISHVLDPLFCAGRQFCITKEGYIGLVPKLSCVGDVVVILYGAKTPHVLRSVPRSHEFQLVGEAYIHGFMDYGLDESADGVRTFRLR